MPTLSTPPGQQNVIIDTATRIVKRFTTDNPPSIDSTESAILLSTDPPAVAAGYLGLYQLDNSNNYIAATQTNVQAAGLDPAFNIQRAQTNLANYKNAITTCINDPSLNTNLHNFFVTLQAVIK